MKHIHLIYIFIMVLFLACNHPGGPVNHGGKEDSADLQSDSLKGGNLVKSEAPDAETKTIQGYALPRYDDGMAQSPINIISDSAISDSSQMASIQFNTGVTAVENLGHTIQLDFKEGSTTITGGKTYSSRQFHFHTPSEHMIDGMTFPMEMHIVNVLKDSNARNNPQYLVIALLFKMGHENKFITEFLKAIPAEEGKDTLPPGTVNFEDLFKAIPKDEVGRYYFYKGSLTTAPYSETVDWIVKKYVQEASPGQINTIEKMEGDNERHVRALYARKVQLK